jgi:hypothetical protein
MNTQKTKTYCLALAACLGAGLILAISLSQQNSGTVLATGTDKSMTITGSDNVYQSSDVLDYASNYETDKNFRTITFDGHTFESALLHSSLESGTFSIGGSYIVSSSFNSSGYAGIWLAIGLQNIKAVSISTGHDTGTTIEFTSCSAYDGSWNLGEYFTESLSSDGTATYTFTGSYVDSDSVSHTYVPRWVVIGMTSTKKSSNTNPYIAFTSVTLTWNC